MAKKLDFKDFLTVDYAPGMDPLIKRNAKKRKGGDTETSAVGEAVAPGIKAPKPVSGKKADAYITGGKHAADVSMGYGGKHTTLKNPTGKAKPVHVFAYEQVELEEALTPQQRRTRAMNLRRVQAKVELGRERASRRFADLPRLKNRARKEARAFIFKRLAKGMSKDEMSYQRRQEIEKRMDSPAMKKRIDVLATKLLKKVRAAEISRHQTSGQQSQND